MPSYIEIDDITPKIQYTATSGQTEFTFPFIAFSDADLVIYKNSTLLVLTTDYTITNSYPIEGGTVTLNTGATAGDIITIIRDTAIEKTTGWVEGGDFRASTIDKQNAQIFAILQQQERKFNAVPMLPDTSSLSSLSLPTPTANKALLWNSSANALINSTDDFNNIVTNATTQAGIATTQAGLAATAKTAAETAQANAETAETNAEAAEVLAEEWASKTDGQVDSTDYSSKAYAIGGTGVTTAIGAAKEWAITAEDTEVTTGNYSALHHAAKAAASAAAAIVAKIEWQGAWSAGTYNKNDAVEHNGSSWIVTATTTTEEPSISATDWDLLALKGTDGTGAGDVSSDSSVSVDNELVLFKDTTGKLIKRATGNGYVKTTSGVVSNVTTIPPNEGGTGVANNAASTLTISGNYATTLTVTGTTGVTLPTSGTLMANPMTAAGDLIYGGTSGAPTRLAKGTAGYYLKQGATKPEWAAVSSGALTLINTYTASAAHYLDITSGMDSSKYKGYFLIGDITTTDGNINFQPSINNGSSWLTTTTGMKAVITSSGGYSAISDDGSGAALGFRPSGLIFMEVYPKASQFQLYGKTRYDTSGRIEFNLVNTNSTIVNALRFIADGWSSGFTLSGTVYLYGISY